MKWGLKGEISIDADSGPLGYVLWCCGSIFQQLFTFIQIGSGHTCVWFIYVLTQKEHTIWIKAVMCQNLRFISTSDSKVPKIQIFIWCTGTAFREKSDRFNSYQHPYWQCYFIFFCNFTATHFTFIQKS